MKVGGAPGLSEIQDIQERSRSKLSEIEENRQTEEREGEEYGEEANKFIMSADHSQDISLAEDNRPEKQAQNDYSFGNLERISALQNPEDSIR